VSIRLRVEIEESTLPHREKAVLGMLADFGNDEGQGVRPCLETVARRTSLSLSTVRRTARRLEQIGLLVCLRAGGGRHRPTLYRIDLKVLRSRYLAPKPGQPAGVSEKPGQPGTKPGQPGPETRSSFDRGSVYRSLEDPARAREDGARGAEGQEDSPPLRRGEVLGLLEAARQVEERKRSRRGAA
jgi:hypothetical protein